MAVAHFFGTQAPVAKKTFEWLRHGSQGPWWSLVVPGGPWWSLVVPRGPTWSLVVTSLYRRVLKS